MVAQEELVLSGEAREDLLCHRRECDSSQADQNADEQKAAQDHGGRLVHIRHKETSLEEDNQQH